MKNEKRWKRMMMKNKEMREMKGIARKNEKEIEK